MSEWVHKVGFAFTAVNGPNPVSVWWCYADSVLAER